VVKTHDVEKF